MSQELEILRRLESGVTLTPIDALAPLVPGERFGIMTLISRYYCLKRKKQFALVNCDCGVKKEVIVWNLRRNKSCGCLTNDIIRSHRTRHGYSKSNDQRKRSTWSSWKSMIDRCFLKKHKSFNYYGGKGISVSEDWKTFENFLRDMGERPNGKTLDRINNSLGYEKGNCRWSTPREQANNRSSSHFFEFGGKRMTISQWSSNVGIPSSVICARLRKKWPIKKVLSRRNFHITKASTLWGMERVEPSGQVMLAI